MTTTTLPRALLEQALGERDRFQAELAARRAALAQQAEPVYWEVRCTAHPKWMRVDKQQFDEYVAHGWEGQRLYTAPPRQAEPVEPVATHRINSWGFCGVCRHDRIPGEGCARQECPDSPQQAEPVEPVQVADRLARHGIPMPEGDPK